MLASLFALLLVVNPQGAEHASGQERPASERVQEQTEQKQICRYIRGGMGSRRKEKVCMTKDQWREFNQGN
ncbi:MAG: hypothetical protein HKO05_03555 [Erythrobacter sp.]|jgi:Flp pilus assembly protein TadB|nr:hypothetical protein [Erythrobacter sp.]RZV34992.1 MAG: hypothetical protein EX262_03265 [Sphingomonadaceae bacterium]